MTSSVPDTHRGWLIEENWLGEWEATHPNYDPTPVHLYDIGGDDRSVTGKTREAVIEEIDEWFLENELSPTQAVGGLNG
jgi:hypothetical protein